MSNLTGQFTQDPLKLLQAIPTIAPAEGVGSPRTRRARSELLARALPHVPLFQSSSRQVVERTRSKPRRISRSAVAGAIGGWEPPLSYRAKFPVELRCGVRRQRLRFASSQRQLRHGRQTGGKPLSQPQLAQHPRREARHSSPGATASPRASFSTTVRLGPLSLSHSPPRHRGTEEDGGFPGMRWQGGRRVGATALGIARSSRSRDAV